MDLTKFNIGAFNNGSNRQLWCAVGEVWFAPRYLDVTDPGVISKFYSAGKPVSLGTTGLLVDGIAPYLYASGSFTNFGSGFQLQEIKDAGALSYVATPLPDTGFYARSAPTILLKTPLDISEFYDTDGYPMTTSGLTFAVKAKFSSTEWVVFGCGGAVILAIRAANAEDDVRNPLNRSGSCPKPYLGA